MYVFLSYFGLPSGAVWSNIIAEPICVVGALVLGYVFRDRIGRRLATWWHGHRKEHHQEQLDAVEQRLREHISAELERMLAHRRPAE